MNTKRILALLIALMLVFSVVTVLSACGDDTPIADEPTADDPTTDDPTTDDPTTDDPTTDDPTTDDPTEDDPTTDDPTTDDPTTDDPTTDDPTTEEPTTEEPTVEEPTTEEPTTEEPTTEEPTTEEPTEEEKEIVLVKDGVGYFKFVVADGYSSEVNRTVDSLISEIEALGVSTEKIYDNADTITDCEVLIGSVKSRGDQYKIDNHIYGYEGYGIQAIDGRVLILGGSEEALLDAIKEFKEEILGITKKTKKLTDVTMTSEKNIVEIQDNYKIENVTVAGANLNTFVIEAEAANEYELAAAMSVQETLYKKLGMWLPIVEPGTEYDNAIVFMLTDARTCTIKNGFELRITDGNIVVDCGFANKIEEATLAFFMTEVVNSKTPTVTLSNGYTYNKVDYRNIYYKDFGAHGDGYTDDFEEILAAHEYANEFGHTVNADKGAHYYIGTEYQKTLKVIPIKTDVNWTGANFTIDDSVVTVQRNEHKNLNGDKLCDRCGRTLDDVCTATADSWHQLNLFQVQSDYTTDVITEYFEGKSVPKSTTNIGFAPGYKALIELFNDTVKHFIRYGVNENSGNPQREIIIVDAQGNLDPTTPLHWSYEKVSKAYLKCVEDAPITIQGGDFVNIANQAENYYDSYGRNIYITRSNVTVKNITHQLVGTGETRAPYGGFLRMEYANNIEFDNITIDHHENRYDKETGALLGTYEMGGRYSNDIRYLNIKQIDFFEEDGSVVYKGLFGSNYCKNFYFDGCVMTSMDAHCGLYNGTIKNSTFEHMNFIGEGLILIENVTVYADATGGAIKLRDDYGSTWNGEVIVNGLDIRYSKDKYTAMDLLIAKYTDWWFGFETYLPHTIELNNVTVTKYSQVTDAFGNRTETVIAVNKTPLNLVSANIGAYKGKDISRLESQGGGSKYNAYHGPKLLEVTNCPGLQIAIPMTPQFADLEYIRDGEVVIR